MCTGVQEENDAEQGNHRARSHNQEVRGREGETGVAHRAEDE